MTIRRIRRGLAEAVVDDSELGDELLAGLRFPVGRERVGAVGDHVESSLVDVDGRVARCLTERVARGQSVVASCRSNAELEPVEPVEIVTRFDRGVPRRGQPSEPRRVHRVDHGVVRSDPFRLRERVALDGVSHRRCAPEIGPSHPCPGVGGEPVRRASRERHSRVIACLGDTVLRANRDLVGTRRERPVCSRCGDRLDRRSRPRHADALVERPVCRRIRVEPECCLALFRCFEVDGGYCGVGTCVINVNERSIIRR